MIYVGQMCLSWEFLCWEYGKALELWESDPYEARRYNDVANKFQAFQVLLTRFLEDEPFEGPRVQHYVKTRCLFRNLLQVPAVRGTLIPSLCFELVLFFYVGFFACRRARHLFFWAYWS